MSLADLNAIAERRRGSAPDIAAALERVREALNAAESDLWGNPSTLQAPALAALATIEAHIAGIERERDRW